MIIRRMSTTRLDKKKTIFLKDSRLLDELHKQIRVTLYFGGIFMAKSLVYHLKDGYDIRKCYHKSVF